MSRSFVLAVVALLAMGPGRPTLAVAATRPVALGLGVGYAQQHVPSGETDPFIHGRQVQLFARLRDPRVHLQPRLEFLSQSYDLDGRRLTQEQTEPLLADGDRRIRAAVASMEWNIGRARPVRAYVVAGGGRAWMRDRVRLDNGQKFSGRDSAWLASAGFGLTARLGTYGAFVESRFGHAFNDEGPLGGATKTAALTAGLVF